MNVRNSSLPTAQQAATESTTTSRGGTKVQTKNHHHQPSQLITASSSRTEGGGSHLSVKFKPIEHQAATPTNSSSLDSDSGAATTQHHHQLTNINNPEDENYDSFYDCGGTAAGLSSSDENVHVPTTSRRKHSNCSSTGGVSTNGKKFAVFAFTFLFFIRSYFRIFLHYSGIFLDFKKEEDLYFFSKLKIALVF